MRTLTMDQADAIGGGNLWILLTIAGAAYDFAQGFNDAYNAANVQK
jgi:hypothetical protein